MQENQIKQIIDLLNQSANNLSPDIKAKLDMSCKKAVDVHREKYESNQNALIIKRADIFDNIYLMFFSLLLFIITFIAIHSHEYQKYTHFLADTEIGILTNEVPIDALNNDDFTNFLLNNDQ